MNKGMDQRSQAAALLGSLGGQARMIKMTPEARREVARRGAEARWALKRASIRPIKTR